MADSKKIKDPIYGYIEVGSGIARNVIDTATFQRLRNIRQTSYAALYPSSLHNRFVHSLGVYYLGGIALESFIRSIKKYLECPEENGEHIFLEENTIIHYGNIYRLSCLLHDVGHSPFSHTGEDFFTKSRSETKTEIEDPYSIYKHLSYLTEDDVFLKPQAKNASPHEIMSSIVALEKFGDDLSFFENAEEKSFFARCITGILYEDAINIDDHRISKVKSDELRLIHKHMMMNCMIQLLHSSVIDVDRLDYIIRDATTMGYKSVSIDYQRLLWGIEVVWIDEYNFAIGFHKNAISVIENAVYAHDNEKKWVQSHPVILYDSYLVSKAIGHIEDQIRKDYPESKSTLFSFDALSESGVKFVSENKQFETCFLSDADIIYLMKSIYKSDYSDEYLNRNKRFVPLWKSEAEYMNLFDEGDRKTLQKALSKVMFDESGEVDNVELDEGLIQNIDADIEEAKEESLVKKVEILELRKKHIRAILNLCQDYNAQNKIILLKASFFKSNFSKENMRSIMIYFPNSTKHSKLGDVATTLFSKESDHEETDFVYLFYRSLDNEKKMDIAKFSNRLVLVLRDGTEKNT